MNSDEVFASLKAILQADPVCAQNWRDTLVSVAIDEGVSDETSKVIAERFMAHYFEV